jgi:hypothetical protein
LAILQVLAKVKVAVEVPVCLFQRDAKTGDPKRMIDRILRPYLCGNRVKIATDLVRLRWLVHFAPNHELVTEDQQGGNGIVLRTDFVSSDRVE